jgi:transcriptional regulator with XRE-family HTH domain
VFRVPVQPQTMRWMADTSMKTFGEHLRNLRKARGMSQNELGDLAGVNDKYLGEVERGSGNPTLELLTKLAKALDVDLATLVGDPLALQDRQQVRAEANKRLDAMTDNELRTLVRLLRLQGR